MREARGTGEPMGSRACGSACQGPPAYGERGAGERSESGVPELEAGAEPLPRASRCPAARTRGPCVGLSFSRHEPAPEPQAVSERADGEAGDGEAEVGDGVQGLPRLRGRLHEHAACKHRRVHRRCVVWTPG